jgi:hypothetical protein
MQRFNILAVIGIWVFAMPAYAEFGNEYVEGDDNLNTAAGPQALAAQISAESSTGCQPTVCGSSNTAVGGYALYLNTTGSNNTGVGSQALYENQSANNNTAVGVNALMNNTASNNTAMGLAALHENTSGTANNADGYEALYSNQTGNYNTASGYDALYSTTDGNQNSAAGAFALHNNKSGSFNSALGAYTLYANTSGGSNIAVGEKAGYNLTTGSNNIDIGNEGKAADANTINIGAQGTQTVTRIAGIYNNSSVSGLAVVVDSTGQLGVTSASSERFKTAIAPMGESTSKLESLRPVTFHLKDDPNGVLRYGLIAEEVAKVYPELVVRNEHGQIDGVRYDELAPMILNEMKLQEQRNRNENRHLSKELNAQAVEIRELKAALLMLQAPQPRH